MPGVAPPGPVGPSCESAPTTSARMAFIHVGPPGVLAHQRLGHGIGLSSGARPARIVVRACRVIGGCIEPAGPLIDPMDRTGGGAWLAPFQSFAPRSGGCRSPGPCPLVVGVTALQRCHASAAGVYPPTGSRQVLEEPPVALLGFPSEVFPSAAPVSGLFSRYPPPSCFLRRCPSACGARHPGVSSHSGVGLSFPTAYPSGFRDLLAKVAEVVHAQLRILKEARRLFHPSSLRGGVRCLDEQKYISHHSTQTSPRPLNSCVIWVLEAAKSGQLVNNRWRVGGQVLASGGQDENGASEPFRH